MTPETTRDVAIDALLMAALRHKRSLGVMIHSYQSAES